MANPSKIVFIGATSMSFGLSMLRDIFSSDELRGSTLTLVGIDAAALSKMTELAKLLNKKTGAGLTIEQTTDRRAALDGAQFCRQFDGHRPQPAVEARLGGAAQIRHPPHARRKRRPRRADVHAAHAAAGVRHRARRTRRCARKALFLNFSNPENRIIHALGKYSQIRALGLCHGIFMGQGAVADIMGLPYEQVEVWGAGLNHSQCLLQIRDRKTGEDLYPRLREKEKTYDASFLPLTRQVFRAFGYWMTCSDDHFGEYLAYGWEGGEHGYDFAADERGRVEFAAQLDRVLAGAPVPADWLTPSGERGAAAIGGIMHDKKRVLESGIVYNQGVIPNLPADAAVEVPVMADAAGIHPISLGPLPDAIAKLLTVQVQVQQLAIEAAVRGSKEIALQALLIDPVVNSATAAVKLLDELWDINRPYIRPCL